MVSAMIDNIAAGMARDEILPSYPALTEADIDAALAYAAELAREGCVRDTAQGVRATLDDFSTARSCFRKSDLKRTSLTVNPVEPC
jgi:hypothetical protein